MSERLTVQEIGKRAMSSIGLPMPSSIVNDNDDAARQLLQCLYEVSADMIAHSDWQILKASVTFQTVAGENQGNLRVKFPDFRRLVDQTTWNLTAMRQLIGPISSQDWQRMKINGASAVDSCMFRIIGDNFHILGQSVAGETIALEYISNLWLLDANGLDRKSEIKKSSDICLLPADAMTAGVQWRYLYKNGQDSTAAFADYRALRDERRAEDGGTAHLSLVPRRRNALRSPSDARVVGYE